MTKPLDKLPSSQQLNGQTPVNPTGVSPPAPPRKVGRPRGTPKTGGRQKGVAKWDGDRVRTEALPPALELLLGVIKGDAQLVDGGMRTNADLQSGTGVWRRPDLKQCLRAAEIVMAKTLPDLKATELVAAVDQRVTSDAEPQHDVRQTARAIIAVLSSAAAAGVDVEFEGVGGPTGRCDVRKEPARSPNQKISGSAFDTLSSVPSGGSNGASAPVAPDPASPASAADDSQPDGSVSSAAELGEGILSTPPSVDEPDIIRIGGCGAAVMLADVLRDSRKRWAIVDGDGHVVEAHHFDREAAVAQCRLLVEQGVI